MKTLLLMRHAKSDWDADYGDDHDRPLNERGTRSARLMGRVLADEGLEPAHVISSTALRARTTAELANEAGEWGARLSLERALYDEGPKGVLATVASTPDVARLMLVGHQPTWSMLVAISLMRSEAVVIWSAWWPAASASCSAVACVSWVDAATCTEVSLIVVTRLRSSSTA